EQGDECRSNMIRAALGVFLFPWLGDAITRRSERFDCLSQRGVGDLNHVVARNVVRVLLHDGARFREFCEQIELNAISENVVHRVTLKISVRLMEPRIARFYETDIGQHSRQPVPMTY